MDSEQQLYTIALRLPVAKRAALAARLIQSLDETEQDTPAEVDAAWSEEIQNRLRELDAGTAVTVSKDEFLAEYLKPPKKA